MDNSTRNRVTKPPAISLPWNPPHFECVGSENTTIFILGVGLHSVTLNVRLDCTVGHVALALRIRRLIPDPQETPHALYFDVHSLLPLKEKDRLCDIGVRQLSTLNLRFPVRGGSYHTAEGPGVPVSGRRAALSRATANKSKARQQQRMKRSEETRRTLRIDQEQELPRVDSPTSTAPFSVPPDGGGPSVSALETSLDIELNSLAREVDHRKDLLDLRRTRLVFRLSPQYQHAYTDRSVYEIWRPNDGSHSLVDTEYCNTTFIGEEDWIFVTLQRVQEIKTFLSMSESSDTCERVTGKARELLGILEAYRKLEWLRQKAGFNRVASYAQAIDTSHHFERPLEGASSLVVACFIASAALQLFSHLSDRSSGLNLAGLNDVLRLTGVPNSLPKDPRTIMGKLRLDPVTRSYVCCMKCWALYPRPAPLVCTNGAIFGNRPTDDAALPEFHEGCGEGLYESLAGSGQKAPVFRRVYHHQVMGEWLGSLLSRLHIEDVMDVAHQRPKEGSTQTDIWDSDVLEQIKDTFGNTFIHPPPAESLNPNVGPEGRYVFTLAMDGFNPFFSTHSGPTVSSTGIYMACLNLPPHLRFKLEYMYLVGIIPGPSKPSVDEINHFLRPLVDELNDLWRHGIFFSRTAKYRDGRLAKCALGPLVCDLLAARQASGLMAPGGTYFCSVCWLTIQNIEDFDRSKWIPRTSQQHRDLADSWKKLDASGRKQHFEEHGIRWSALLDLIYWDIILFTIIDAMHNHDLGIVQDHCRVALGMSYDAADGSTGSFKRPPKPTMSAMDLAVTYVRDKHFHMLEERDVSILWHLCKLYGLRRAVKEKGYLMNKIREWRATDAADEVFKATPTTPVEGTDATSPVLPPIAAIEGLARLRSISPAVPSMSPAVPSPYQAFVPSPLGLSVHHAANPTELSSRPRYAAGTYASPMASSSSLLLHGTASVQPDLQSHSSPRLETSASPSGDGSSDSLIHTDVAEKEFQGAEKRYRAGINVDVRWMQNLRHVVLQEMYRIRGQNPGKLRRIDIAEWLVRFRSTSTYDEPTVAPSPNPAPSTPMYQLQQSPDLYVSSAGRALSNPANSMQMPRSFNTEYGSRHTSESAELRTTSPSSSIAEVSRGDHALFWAQELYADPTKPMSFSKLKSYPLKVLRPLCLQYGYEGPMDAKKDVLAEWLYEKRGPDSNGKQRAGTPGSTTGDNSDNSSRHVLGKATLNEVRRDIARTSVPRWVTPAPKGLGSPGMGSLGADDWHSVATIYLPLTLTRLWGGSDNLNEKAMLDNLMHLVTAVTIGGSREMSDALVAQYQDSMQQYLTSYLDLYKETTIKPNHHLAVHIGHDVLPRYGPLHPIRAFGTERMNFVLQSENTNSHFGEMEMTYLHQTCRFARFRAIVRDFPEIREILPSFVRVWEKLEIEDVRGTRLQDIFSWQAPLELVASAASKRRNILQNDEHAALLKFLNAERDIWRGYVGFTHDGQVDGRLPLPSTITSYDSAKMRGVSYTTEAHLLRDSNVVFEDDRCHSAGRIKAIFQHWRRRTDSEDSDLTETFIIIRRFKELVPQDKPHDIYRTYHAGGWLCYEEYDPNLVVVRPAQILCHAACTSLPSVWSITRPCIRVLPMDMCKVGASTPSNTANVEWLSCDRVVVSYSSEQL